MYVRAWAGRSERQWECPSAPTSSMTASRRGSCSIAKSWVSEDVLRTERAQISPARLSWASLRAEEAGRFPLAQGCRPAGDLLPRSGGQLPLSCSTPVATAAPIVCTEREGNRRRFQCIYHGWTYGNDGRLVGVPGANAYGRELRQILAWPAAAGAVRGVSRTSVQASRRGRRSVPDYLAGAKDYIDLVIDQSPSGQMEIIAGVQEYDVAANWKLMVENSVDDYHRPRPIRPGSTSWPIRA